jgi:hypothetical protein
MSSRLSRLGIVLGLAAMASTSHAVPIIEFGGAVAADGSGLTTAVSGATVFDFNDGSKPAGYSGDGGVVSGSVSGQYAAPAGDTTPYLTVALNSSSGTETILQSAFNYFGLYWGSMDDYNTLSFYFDDTVVASLTGAEVIAAGTQLGDQTAPGSNRYVNFYFGSSLFNKVVIQTSQYAFESDNHAFARVPEPGSLGLLGAGLLGFGLFRRKRA